MPATKRAFQFIFTINTHHRELIKQRMDISIDTLAQNCWQACDDGRQEDAMAQYRILTKVWEEHKSVVDNLLRQIGEGTLDAPPADDSEDSNLEEEAAD
jgi:hypothetical protein